MADNVGYTPGTGALVAADEIAGVLHQRVKIGVGADGSAVDVSAANPLPITAPTALDVQGTVDITTAAPIDVQGTVGITTASPIDVQGTVAITTAAPLDVTLDGVSALTPLPVVDSAAEDTRQSMVMLLTRMLNYFNAPMGYDKSLQRQRGTVVLESGTVTTVSTVTTVTTVSSVTNIAAVGGYNAAMQILDTNRVAWAQCVRARIT